MIGDQIGRNPVKIEALAAADNRRQHLLGFGRRENEFHVRRRLFQRLEQRVERGRREHVDFVDDVDFETRLGRRVTGVFAQLAHLFDAVVAGAVDLEHIEAVPGGDLAAIVARPTASPSVRECN